MEVVGQDPAPKRRCRHLVQSLPAILGEGCKHALLLQRRSLLGWSRVSRR